MDNGHWFQKCTSPEFGSYIHMSRYSKWQDDLQRREFWYETVDRYFQFFDEYIQTHFSKQVFEKYKKHVEYAKALVLEQEVMPSMRCLMTAGEALKKHNVAGYNCAYKAVINPRALPEYLYNLMCGTGQGFSVERQYVQNWPEVPNEFHKTSSTVVVRDSKIGWAAALNELIAHLYAGSIPEIDTSKVRPAGSRLKTFGGRASGPEPLEDLFDFTIATFVKAKGRKLTSIEIHDLVCKIADSVVCGGVRRSALISLSNLSDDRMRLAKTGNWFDTTPIRRLANNSAVYTDKPDFNIFFEEWKNLFDSKSGERGIFNREAATIQVGRTGRRDTDHIFGVNPCGEIILRDTGQLCNLSEIIGRPTDNTYTLRDKARVAAFLGTLQSLLTDFKFLGAKWRHNTEEERLLGVSITGIFDNPLLYDPSPDLLSELRDEVIAENLRWANIFKIPQSVATTCVKPSGTVSTMLDVANGIHPRWDHYYICNVQGSKHDPLAQMMVDNGFPHEEYMFDRDNTWVFQFPVKAPEQSVTKDEVSAIDQLSLYHKYRLFWCEHNPSTTVYIDENEWFEVGDWVWKNFDDISGVAFLPKDGGAYRQAPRQSCDVEDYVGLVSRIPQNIDWSQLRKYETEDNSPVGRELECSSGSCDI